MLLAIDASTLVSELLRTRGQQLLAHADLNIVVATETWGEATYELEKRLGILLHRGHVRPDEAETLRAKIELILTEDIVVLLIETYAEHVGEATWRIPRDPNDVATVALALASDCGIWTGDRDFFGCGLPVWTTDTLLSYLDIQGSK